MRWALPRAPKLPETRHGARFYFYFYRTLITESHPVIDLTVVFMPDRTVADHDDTIGRMPGGDFVEERLRAIAAQGSSRLSLRPSAGDQRHSRGVYRWLTMARAIGRRGLGRKQRRRSGIRPQRASNEKWRRPGDCVFWLGPSKFR